MFAYRHLTELHDSITHSTPYAMLSVQDLLSNPSALPIVEVSPTVFLLSDGVMDELRVVNPLAEENISLQKR